jgi:hypothetical protein
MNLNCGARYHAGSGMPVWMAAILLPVGAVLLLAAACGGGQQGSSDAAAGLVKSQTSSSCEAPPLPPGTPTPLLVDPLANYVPTPEPAIANAVGAPSKQVADEVTAAIRNFVNCWNQRKFESVGMLATPRFLKSIFEQLRAQDTAIIMNGLPDIQYDLRSLGDMQKLSDARVSVAFDYVFVHEERKGHWYFLKQNGWWLMDREIRVKPDVPGGKDSSVIDVEGKDFSYVITPATPSNKPVTVFHAHNSGGLDHDFLVVKVIAQIDPRQLLQPNLTHPQGIEFIAQTSLGPGEEEDMVTFNMTPGTYIFICQFRHPDGTPHAQKGMVAQFTIQ